MQSYSSSLSFPNIVELINDRGWLKDYASLSVIGTPNIEKEKEALFRLRKLGTDYYLCVSIFQLSSHSLILLTFYGLFEDRFGKEQKIRDEIVKTLEPQIRLIKERLDFSKAKTEFAMLKTAVRFTTRITKVPLERLIPYKSLAGVVVINIIALLVLLYLGSIQAFNSTLAVAIYTLILMISLEAVRLKMKR